MSSKAEPEGGWSLTRRMAITFAITTSSIVLLFGAGSNYLVWDNIRDHIKDYMEHELVELEHNLQPLRGELDNATIEEQLRRILEVSRNEARSAFRVRDTQGNVLAEQGELRLLEQVTQAVTSKDKWDRYLADGIAIDSRKVAVPHGRLEILYDTTGSMRELWRYMQASFLTFLLSVVLAGVAGAWTASRGLRGLREVVNQARHIDFPAGKSPIRMEGAPIEVREVGSALNRMLRRIDHGLRNMRTFTAGLAHELRSPLQNLIGETEVTLLAPRAVDDYQRLLRSNLEELHDLSDAVDNLVVYCRDSDPMDRQKTREAFDLSVEARIRIDRLRRSAEHGGVHVQVTVDGDTRINADREACLRVVRNLVANAVEWSPVGSTVEVSMQGKPDTVRLEVRDHGPGIPDNLKERVFKPFVSGARSQGRRAGYGLGLAICRSAVEDHGGFIRHEAAAGGGTRFIVELPRSGGRLLSEEPEGGRPRRAQWSAREKRVV